ncbi:MAG: tetratricopeptide repeat protein, partial [Dolichospermum sp.]
MAIARTLKDFLREGQAVYNLGNLFSEQDNYIQAIDYFQKSVEIGEKNNNFILHLQSLRALGVTYFGLGDFGTAIKYAEKTVKIVKETDNSQQDKLNLSTLEKNFIGVLYQQSLSLLGTAYLFDNASHEKAIGNFQQNLELAKTIPSSNNQVTALVNAYLNLGNANYFIGNYDKAIEYYEEALAIRRSIKEPQFERINRQIEGNNLQALSSVYASKGDIKKSVKYAQESLAIAQEDKNIYGEAGALGNLGRALFLAGNLPEAEKTLREAIKLFESVRTKLGEKDLQKVSFFDIYTDVYELLQQVLIAQNQSIAALEIAEQGRAKSFSELLVSRTRLTKIPGTLFNLEQIKKVAKQQNATLIQYSIIYNSSQALVPARIRGLQPKQESKLLIWVVEPTGKIEFRSVDLKK